ncbi:hypothetical protein PVK06_005287 [Gossypium arboreum]|uniref:Uncharacterized protein n=1 Tax=Gossypium arboreum TaxID=29729 RepID=A0ABR0QV81_GOSAR|nr:hypothetical protein PVK06_005287 [Gossypium arboreum]
MEETLIVLGCMDIDLALREEQHAPFTAESTSDAKRDFERWDCSNCMSPMIMKHNIPKAFRGIESEKITQAKGFLDKIEKHFGKNSKVEMTALLTSLMSIKYNGQENSKRSKGYEFYGPTIKNIFETRIATFFEDVEFRGRNKVRDIAFEEELDSN